MRKVELKYVTIATVCFIAAALIIMAGIRAFVTAEAPSAAGAPLFQQKGCASVIFQRVIKQRWDRG